MIVGLNPRAGRTLARCGIDTEITAAQFAALSALPDPVEPVARRHACDLAAGHEDEHLAFVVASDGGDTWWWLCWGERGHLIVQIDPCDVTDPELPALEICLLPAGHPGSHSFDLLPWSAGNVDGPLN